MKKSFVVLFALVLIVFCGCKKDAGNPIAKNFSIEGSYTILQVEDAFKVIVDDTATQITVTAGENVMPNVVVEKDSNTLKIYVKGTTNYNETDWTVILPYNADLKSVNLSGASEFHSEYGLEGNKVKVTLSGASDFNCGIDADKIEMSLSGSSIIKSNVASTDLNLGLSGASDATLKGQVETLKISLSGSSNIVKKIVGNRYALVCDRCEGSMSGSCDAYIHCDGTIKVNLSGSSNLHYTGNATTTGSDTSGGSDISHDAP